MTRNPQHGIPARHLTPGPPPRPRPALDDIDRALLHLLGEDGRRPVADLARRLGLAESTCAGRVRALRERGVIRGIHADVDPAALGAHIEAMVAIRFSGHVRANVESFRDEIARIPGVLAIHNTSGATDYLVHVAAAGSDALRTSSSTTSPTAPAWCTPRPH